MYCFPCYVLQVVVVEQVLDLKLHYVADVEGLVLSFFFKTLNIFRCDII